MKCCFCGAECGEWGNNPWPANKEDNAVCCDACNSSIVVPARLFDMLGGDNSGKTESEKCDEAD